MSDDGSASDVIAVSNVRRAGFLGVRQHARDWQPNKRLTTARRIRLQARFPTRDRDKDSMGGIEQHYRHNPLHGRNKVEPCYGCAKWKIRLVNHDIELIASEPRASPQPQAQSQVHRPIAVAVWNPLDEQSPWRRELMEKLADATQVR